MLSAIWESSLGLFAPEENAEQESADYNVEQAAWQAPSEPPGAQVEQQELRAVWDPPQSGASYSGSTTAAASTGGQEKKGGGGRRRESQKDPLEIEDPEERRERIVAEQRENIAKAFIEQNDIETVGDAVAYCSELVDKQLQRALEQKAEMNVAIYGDSSAKRAIATLLPDALIRGLFLRTTRRREAWPRIRSLFGVPPYHFLKPEDAGLVRASGISSSRKNMTYERANETAAYSQFGSGHLVDSYFREYRIVPSAELHESANLPCDVEKVDPSAHIFMNVRVPKRSRAEKVEILKSISKRKAVMFPQVGEELLVQYSDSLRQVWGKKALIRTTTRMVVKTMVPRAANASTAALVAVKL